VASLTRRDFLVGLAAAPTVTSVAGEARVEELNRRPDFSRTIARLRVEIPDKLVALDVPGAAIALIFRNEILWAHGFGFTARGSHQPVTPATIFSVQSMSKSYTTVGVLKAIERGWFGLDDPVELLVPGFTVRSRFSDRETSKITLRHLLSHFAGLCHEAPLGGNYDDRPCTFAEHVASISDTWLARPVGTAFGYSNLGFDLAGYVLQLRSGKNFEHYMQEAVLEPLNMMESTFDQHDAAQRLDIAKGNMGSFEVPRLRIPMLAAGGLYSSVRDLSRFVSLQLSGENGGGSRLVSPALLSEMASPQFAVPGQIGGYGLGLYNVPGFGTYSLLHQGGGYGYSAVHRWSPDYGIGVVVICNQEYGNPAPALAFFAHWLMVAELLGAVPPTAALAPIRTPAVPLDLKQLRHFEARYRRPGDLVTAQVRSDYLMLMDADATNVLDAHTPAVFTNQNRKYTFITGENGAVNGIHFLSANYTTNASEYWPVNDTPHDEPGPNKPEWNAFVGRYNGYLTADELSVQVFLKNGYLYIDGQASSSWYGGIRLSEYRHGLFFTADGESVEFSTGKMALGNRPFVKGPG
jgi:CubicO group peptidase (beta-lactamase class C family)